MAQYQQPILIWPASSAFEQTAASQQTTVFQEMELRQLICVHLHNPRLEPFQRWAFQRRHKLTLLIGNLDGASKLIENSLLFRPLEDFLIEEATGMPLGSGPVRSTFKSRLDIHSWSGVPPPDVSSWLSKNMPSISCLQIAANIRLMSETEALLTVQQLCSLIYRWAPQLRQLTLWLGSTSYFDQKEKGWNSDLMPLWNAINSCSKLCRLDVDIDEWLPNRAIGCIELTTPLTILRHLEEFNFTSENISVWNQVKNARNSQAILGLSNYLPANDLLACPLSLTARFSSIGICQVRSPLQLLGLFSYKRFSLLSTLFVECTEELTFLQLLEAVSSLHLETLRIRLGFTDLFRDVEKVQLSENATVSLSTVKALAIEKDWLMVHSSLDLGPLCRLLPGLQTLSVVIKLAICQDCTQLASCARELLLPMRYCARIRQIAIELGPNSFKEEFTLEELTRFSTYPDDSHQVKPLDDAQEH